MMFLASPISAKSEQTPKKKLQFMHCWKADYVCLGSEVWSHTYQAPSLELSTAATGL